MTSRTMNIRPRMDRQVSCIAVVMLSLVAAAAATPLASPSKPVPTHADIAYGPHAHQLLDIYLPTPGAKPCPVLLWFGGIWKPAKHAPDPGRFLSAGCAVVAVETRTLTDGMTEKANPPVSYVMNDACRAVQFARHIERRRAGRFQVGRSRGTCLHAGRVCRRSSQPAKH